MRCRNDHANSGNAETVKLLFFADTPVQVANCTSLALRGTQKGASEERHLFIYGNFSNAGKLYKFALNSGAFQKIYLLKSESLPTKGLGKLQTYEILLRLYFGGSFLKDIPEFILTTPYSALFFSCPTVVTYDLFLRLRNTNPNLQVFMYEDGTGTYTGNVFRGLAFTGRVPETIKNRPGVDVVKKALSHLAKNYQSYPVEMLYIKQPSLIEDDFGIPVTKFSLTTEVMDSALLSPPNLVEKIAKAERLVLEPPEEDTSYGLTVEIERFLLDHDVAFAVRRHPRTLTASQCSDSVLDCTGGLWESLCAHLNSASSCLIGFCSSSMLAPAIEYGYYPRIVILDRMDGTARSRTDSDLIIRMLKTLYSGREHLIALPQTTSDLISFLDGNKTFSIN